jgi:hypothetical protein
VAPAGLLNYLGREKLREDLPQIPGPPHLAERTLYDTLRGAVNSTGKSEPTPQNSGRLSGNEARSTQVVPRELPLLPAGDASAPARTKKDAQREVQAASKIAPEIEIPSPVKRAEKRTQELRAAEPKIRDDQKTQDEHKPRAAKNAAAVGKLKFGKHDPTIAPTPRGSFRYNAPEFYRGIYVNNGVARSQKRYEELFARCRKYRINTLVADVQPRFPTVDFIRQAREAGFYLVARVVVFEGGLSEPKLPIEHLNRILDTAEQAARQGFMEVQLDYIRFADRNKIGNLSYKERYHKIASVLKMATDRLRPHGVRVGADIFGRIPFNQNDPIGQRIEVFASHLDTLYPMLYPSHFYGDPLYMRDPYAAVLHGQRKSLQRVDEHTRVIAYIQAFQMKVGKSGLSYQEYIRKQIQASVDSGGAGFISWNARNQYAAFFRALEQFDRSRQTTTRTVVPDAPAAD